MKKIALGLMIGLSLFVMLRRLDALEAHVNGIVAASSTHHP